MEIIVRNKNSWKGKSIVEMAKNLESEGYPPELNPEQKDRVRSFERRIGRNIRKEEVRRVL